MPDRAVFLPLPFYMASFISLIFLTESYPCFELCTILAISQLFSMITPHPLMKMSLIFDFYRILFETVYGLILPGIWWDPTGIGCFFTGGMASFYRGVLGFYRAYPGRNTPLPTFCPAAGKSNYILWLMPEIVHSVGLFLFLFACSYYAIPR